MLPFSDIFSVLENFQNILLISHKKPDADTLGAHFGFAEALQREGKRTLGYCATDLPQSFHFLSSPHAVTSDADECRNFQAEAVIIFDSSDLVYAGCDTLLKALPLKPIILNIDHHESNTLFGDVTFVDTTASSTAEIVYALITQTNRMVTPSMATALLAGIVSDTSRFTNPGTTASSLKTAASLLKSGADYTSILEALSRKPLPRLRLWGDILTRLHYNVTFGFVCAILRREDMITHQVTAEDCEGLANFLIHELGGTARGIAVLIEQADGTIKGSFRTTDALLNVEKIAKMVGVLGGGGHRKASGFTLPGKIERTASGFHIA